MHDMGTTLILWAAILGAIAAGSMILGAIVGITTPMSNGTVGAMAGFGAGGLLGFAREESRVDAAFLLPQRPRGARRVPSATCAPVCTAWWGRRAQPPTRRAST